MTPLCSPSHGSPESEIIRMLWLKGADPKIKSLAGETALDWARKVGPKSAVESLKSAGAVETGRVPFQSPLPRP